MDAKYLKLDIANKLAVVTLHRPEKRNSISPEVLLEIETLFKEISDNNGIHVVVLTGGEKYFCSGFDLNYIRTLEKDSNEDYIRLFHRAYRAILFCSQPVIAAVGGPAIAGGFDLTQMCDIRYASTRARFGQREIALSLTPIMDPLWRIIGMGRAKEVALTGRIYDADEAEKMGYVSKVFPEGKLLAEVVKIATQMATYDRICLRETKMLSNTVLNQDLDTSMTQQEWLFRTYIGSKDNHRRVDQLLASLKK